MQASDQKPRLFLIPCSLGDPASSQIPMATLSTMDELNLFIVERASTARRLIKVCLPEKKIDDLEIYELDKHEVKAGISDFVKKMIDTNRSAGLLSEAGCPGVADPGALVVAQAHKAGIRVIPLVGPSSILLALMASGMNGQSFAFHGYLPVKKPELSKALKRLEDNVGRGGQTQLFIEAPYRNQSLIQTACNSLRPDTILCMAMDLTLPTELIIRQPVKAWKQQDLSAFHKRPAIFLIGR